MLLFLILFCLPVFMLRRRRVQGLGSQPVPFLQRYWSVSLRGSIHLLCAPQGESSIGTIRNYILLSRLFISGQLVPMKKTKSLFSSALVQLGHTDSIEITSCGAAGKSPLTGTFRPLNHFSLRPTASHEAHYTTKCVHLKISGATRCSPVIN